MNYSSQLARPVLQPSYCLTEYQLGMVDRNKDDERRMRMRIRMRMRVGTSVCAPIPFFVGTKRVIYTSKEDRVIQIPPRSSVQIADRMYSRSQTQSSRKRYSRSIRRRGKSGDETLWPPMLHNTMLYQTEFFNMKTKTDVENYIVFRCTEFFDGKILFVVPYQNEQFRIKVLTNDAYYGHKFLIESFPTFLWDMYPMTNNMYTYIVATSQ